MVETAVQEEGSRVLSTEEVKDYCIRSMEFLATQILDYKDWDTCHDEVNKFLARPSKKKALLLPRGHLKTTLVTITKSIQFILRNPNIRILIANQVWDRSRDILREIKGHLEGGKLPAIFGAFSSGRWTEDAIIVKGRKRSLKEPTIATTGIESETTGGHYDVIFLDDLIGLQNSQTPEQREKAKRFRRSMINLLEPGGKVIEVGTRWHLDDTFAEIFEKESDYYDVMVKKVVDEEGKVLFPKKFSQIFDTEKKTWTVDPTGKSLDYIDYLKKSLPPAEFSAQYLNEPIDEENQIFKPSYFQYYTGRKDDLYRVLTVDLAIAEGKVNDKTSMVVTGMSNDRKIYVLDYLAGKWPVHGIIENLFDMQRKWNPNAVGLETTGFQRVLKWALEREMGLRRIFFPIEELRSPIVGNAKEMRIKSMEPFYRRGDVFHHESMRGRELETQLATFPRGKHDDTIDALSYALQLLLPGREGAKQEAGYMSGDWWLNMAHRGQKDRNFFNHG